MQLQTKIPFQKETRNPIDYNAKLFLLGSCFSKNIGNKFSYFKFQSVQNPTGILFHPKAIEKLIIRGINSDFYTEKDLFYLNDMWHCFDTHSKLSSSSKEELLQNINNAVTTVNQQIKNASHIIITLGTAWIYRFIESDIIVSNCHKVPQKKFLKELLTVDEVEANLTSIISLIKLENPYVSVLFTISPIRHLKDGFLQNQQSKAHLLTAIHKIVEPKNKIHYFPSYELMMDELRDYRFYSEDMIHPNQTAIDYIWEKFSINWISDDALEIMKKVNQIQTGLHHKPFNSSSEMHQQFLVSLQKRIKSIKIKYPHISF